MNSNRGLIILSLIVFSAALALEPGASATTDPDQRTLIEPPSRAVARLVGLEHGPAASDVLWLDVVQMLGAPEFTPSLWPRLRNDGLTASRFDPYNYVIFLGLGVVLTHYANDVEGANEVLLEGTSYNPENPKLWVQLGYNAYFVMGEPLEASKYWSRAADQPDAPHYIGGLAALARYQSGNRGDAVAILEELLMNAEPGLQRNALEVTLKELRSEQRLEAYDRACAKYRSDHGKWPQEPRTLPDAGYLALPPEDEFGYPIYLDIDDEREPGRRCIARSDGVGPRQFERAELIGSEAKIRDAKNE